MKLIMPATMLAIVLSIVLAPVLILDSLTQPNPPKRGPARPRG